MFSNPEKNLIQFGISEGISVADIGSGNGYYALALASKVGEAGKVFCIDIQKDLLEKVGREAENEGFQNVEIIWSDIEKEKGSTLKDESVEVVVVANTFFQIEHKENVANEIVRILKLKGRLLFIEWSDSFAGMGPHKNHVVEAYQVKKMFNDAGLVFEREIDAGEHHYGLVFRKN